MPLTRNTGLLDGDEGLPYHQVTEEPFVGIIRQFDTGATRDTEAGKHDPEGFLSPAVIDRFNTYMHQHRTQSDGTLRDSDNWQRGMPRTAYMKSMWRHFLDLWKAHRGLPAPPIQESLCAMLFNVQGYLFEELKGGDER